MATGGPGRALNMKQEAPLIRAQLKTPRVAAVAGIIFSVLLIAELVVFQLLVRADPRETGAWLRTSSNEVALALNLVPFAGIAFLWFIGVLRDRLGELEDRFFATVFLGSGLVFLAMLFASAGVAGGIILTYATQPQGFVDSPTFAFGRALFHELINLYAVKMASVFMISTSVIGLRTGFHWRVARTIRRKQAAFRAKTKLAPANGINKPPNAGPIIPEMLNCKPLKVAAEGNSASETT
jgi:hypothetical protein